MSKIGTSKWFAVGMCAVLLSGVATVAFAGDAAKSERKAAKHQKADQTAPHGRRADAAVFMATLAPTDAQRQLIVEKAREAAPIVVGVRQEAHRIVVQALAASTKDGAKPDRKAIRAGVKDQIRALREKARTQIAPLADEVVASFTPEQRERIQGLSGKRGKTFDDARLARIVGRLLGRPTAVASLEAR